ncbi:MAG: HD domain-containing protein [Candidatus Woesearchaeota archaeon]
MTTEQTVYSREELLQRVLEYNPKANTDLVSKAYDFSSEAHKNQTRDSGEAYFMHCLAVAEILTELKADSATIAAGLLHDTLEDTNTTQKKTQK